MTRFEKSSFGIALLLISSVLWLPIWRIDLWAPQYPEGLSMRIGSSFIDGNVDQINLLNHYIGMKKIIPDQIPELAIIPWVVVSLLALGVVVILVNKKKWGKVWLAAVGLASVGGLVDFYKWGYNYGHNLDPEAPIKIPGLTYQPPLFGFKKILNIEAYSWPDLGTYAFALGLLVAVAVFFGLPCILCRTAAGKKAASGFLFFLCVGGCTGTKPEPLEIGVDDCHTCHMKITDSRFGGEIVTTKGRVYKFDSIQCLQEYLAKNPNKSDTIYVADYFSPDTLVKADEAGFLNSSSVSGPMGPGVIATKDLGALEKFKILHPGKVTDWKGLPASSF